MGTDIKNHRKSASKNVTFAPDASIEFFLIKTHVRNGTLIDKINPVFKGKIKFKIQLISSFKMKK